MYRFNESMSSKYELFTVTNKHATATMSTLIRLSEVLPLQLLHAGR